MPSTPFPRSRGYAIAVLVLLAVQASVTGTITTRGGRSVTVDMTWEGTGPMETTSNTTTFPGFTGHFTGMRRDGVATGTVVVDGETLVDGSTTNAEIETLEDRNISHP